MKFAVGSGINWPCNLNLIVQTCLVFLTFLQIQETSAFLRLGQEILLFQTKKINENLPSFTAHEKAEIVWRLPCPQIRGFIRFSFDPA